MQDAAREAFCGARTLEIPSGWGWSGLGEKLAGIDTGLCAFPQQSAKLSGQSSGIERGSPLLAVLGPLVQNQPDHLGDPVRHRPRRAFALNSRLQTPKQPREERVFGVDGSPRNLTQQASQVLVPLRRRWL